MSSEMTELMKIVLYLLLSLGGGVLVAILSILSIILIGAMGAWLVHTASFRKPPNPTVTNRTDIDKEGRSIPCILDPLQGLQGKLFLNPPFQAAKFQTQCDQKVTILRERTRAQRKRRRD